MRTPRIVVCLVLPVATLLATAGCSVTAQDQPHPIDLPGQAAGAPATAPTGQDGSIAFTIFLTRDDKLTAVTRTADTAPSAEQQLRVLLSGPASVEKQQDITSALAGTALGLTVQVQGLQAVVELATSLDSTGRTDDILAFAQIVCTLTSRSDVGTVTFTRDGTHVEVPRADGSLSGAPLTTADYASLIAAR